MRTFWVLMLFAIGCGPELEAIDTGYAEAKLDHTTDINTCHGDPGEDPPEPGLKKNTGTDCLPIAKYNADAIAGVLSPTASYKKFKECLSDCIIPGVGTLQSKACHERLASCQRHLTGEAYKLAKRRTF